MRPHKSHGRPPPKSQSLVPAGHRVVIGDHAIREAIKVHAKKIDKMILQENWERSQDLKALQKLAREQRVKIEVKNEAVLDKFGSHQGAAVVVKGEPELDVATLQNREHAIILALDGIEDPHNLGAIWRSSWLMGVAGLLLTEDRSVGLTPVVHKVASGGVEHVPSEHMNQFKPAFDALREQGFWIFGLSHNAQKSIYDLKIPEKVVWVLGSEARGLRTTTEKDCDELISLPQVSADASYNVSVAAGIALAETRRQHQIKK